MLKIRATAVCNRYKVNMTSLYFRCVRVVSCEIGQNAPIFICKSQNTPNVARRECVLYAATGRVVGLAVAFGTYPCLIYRTR